MTSSAGEALGRSSGLRTYALLWCEQFVWMLWSSLLGFALSL